MGPPRNHRRRQSDNLVATRDILGTTHQAIQVRHPAKPSSLRTLDFSPEALVYHSLGTPAPLLQMSFIPRHLHNLPVYD